MELHHVRAFLAVAEELHFGRAATRLHMAQPPLSRTIQQLERQLGASLFDRTTRKVRLTPQGQALLEPARAIVAAFETAERAVNYAGPLDFGRVAVGFAGPSSHGLIRQLAQTVRREAPGIELVLSSAMFGSEALNQLARGELDLAIVRWDSAPPGMSSRVVRVDRFVIVLPEDHVLADRPTIAMTELAEENWVFLPAASGSSLLHTTRVRAEAAGFVPRIVQHGPDTWVILALVAAGVGITLTVDTVFHHAPPDGLAVVPLDDNGEVAFTRLVWRSDNDGLALHRVLELAEDALPTPAEVADRPGS